MTTGYIILEAPTPAALGTEVEAALAEGWKPLGAPFTNRSSDYDHDGDRVAARWYQAMVRDTPEGGAR